MGLNKLLQEEISIGASFDAQAVTNSAAVASNESIDMSKCYKASFLLQSDSTYINTDADVTLNVYEVATDVQTGGTLIAGKTVTISGGASAGVVSGQVDIRDSDLTDGKRYVYFEVVGAGATQTSVMSAVGLMGGLKDGLADKNGLTVARVF